MQQPLLSSSDKVFNGHSLNHIDVSVSKCFIMVRSCGDVGVIKPDCVSFHAVTACVLVIAVTDCIGTLNLTVNLHSLISDKRCIPLAECTTGAL